jgi:1-deoxy-D-xylulose-5-phosphate synthase
MTAKDYSILEQIDYPHQLRALEYDQLEPVCEQLRDYLLNSVSQSSGHLASGLGTVELTVALHYVFDTPKDRVVWDVGHQAYPHKILTGRREQMSTIRQKDGLHPFPHRGESEYDTLTVGHSSTSISAATAMAIAAEREGKDRKVVAVIGDGAMTAGMAFEAMNHAGGNGANMLVVLNDNDMSISENVGALNHYFARIMSGSFYAGIREGSKKLLSGVPPIKELASRMEEPLKGMVVPGTFFEELGFNYIGPIDGHDVNSLVDTLRNMSNLPGPQLLHIVTTKGKGYAPAEKDPIGYHGVPIFDPTKQSLPASKPQSPSYSAVFGDWLCDIAADKKMMAITPAMREGSGMVRFSKEFPQQYFDVAIAEQHAVTLAAGFACEGYKPVVAIYSSFLQRGYDQMIHDVALQNLPVLFAVDRAGIVGADGSTHQGAFDISFSRCIPNMLLMAPADENECRQMLYTGYMSNQPAMVRYPRGTGPGVEIDPTMTAYEVGKAQHRREGKNIAILSFGTLLTEAEKVAATLDATLVNMRFIKPLDGEMIKQMVESHDVIITIEDNSIHGGAGSAVIEYMMANKLLKPVLTLGLPDHFIKHGTQKEIYAELKLDAAGMVEQINDYIQ